MATKKRLCAINGKRVRLCHSCYQSLRRSGVIQARAYRKRNKNPSTQAPPQ